ncbi:hypothetical protein GCM10007938_28850 [Vibrio zhanjiangensis]|uniref:Uncharacterized protein n=1 Tax=Vibrio zhanjiangensis TaxID=1046128 RepID=A0ABQ6F0U5_9VIBR|nr:hypothetical protein GCM10007938_28850 [Vibrio zhanjiangensis]
MAELSLPPPHPESEIALETARAMMHGVGFLFMLINGLLILTRSVIDAAYLITGANKRSNDIDTKYHLH